MNLFMERNRIKKNAPMTLQPATVPDIKSGECTDQKISPLLFWTPLRLIILTCSSDVEDQPALYRYAEQTIA